MLLDMENTGIFLVCFSNFKVCTSTWTTKSKIIATSGITSARRANLFSLITTAKPFDAGHGTKKFEETAPHVFLYDPQKPLMGGGKPYRVSQITI